MKKLMIINLVIGLLIFSSIAYSRSTTNKKMWNQDFDYIITEIERLHPNPYRVMAKEEIESKFEQLLKKVNRLNSDEIIFEIAAIVSSLEDGHTSIVWDQYLSDRYYPVKFKIIDDKLYIIKATDEYAEIIYKEVATINGYHPSNVIDKMASYCSAENEYFRDFLVESRLSFVDFYKNTALASKSGELELYVKDESGYYEYNLPIVNGDDVKELGHDIDFSNTTYGVYNYNFEHVSDKQLLIFNYNDCCTDKYMSFEMFNEHMWSYIEANDIEKIVIDLSRNLGGDARCFRAFFDRFAISELNQQGKAFVVIGNQNYSAGTEAAAMLKRLTAVELIGQPTGGSPQMFGNAEYIETPNHGVQIAVSVDYFDTYPNYNHNAIMPDHSIIKSIEDYKKSLDPIIEYVVAHQ